MTDVATDFTEDTFFEGRIRVRQPKHGYRYAIDAVLLADYAARMPGKRVLDIGTGCGIISLIMAFRGLERSITGVEIQSDIANLAASNVAENGLGERISILEMDAREMGQKDTGGPVDLVVSNPPYRRKNSGRINPHSQKAAARHEINLTLADLLGVARRMLDISGRFAVIYPAERAAELMTGMSGVGIEPKRLLPIYSYKGQAAKLVIVEGMRGGRRGLVVAPPLYIYDPDGEYTDAVQGMFRA